MLRSLLRPEHVRGASLWQRCARTRTRTRAHARAHAHTHTHKGTRNSPQEPTRWPGRWHGCQQERAAYRAHANVILIARRKGSLITEEKGFDYTNGNQAGSTVYDTLYQGERSVVNIFRGEGVD